MRGVSIAGIILHMSLPVNNRSLEDIYDNLPSLYVISHIVSLGSFLTRRTSKNLLVLYYTLYRRPEFVKDVNIDFLFYAGKKILKINQKVRIDIRI